MGRHLGNVEGSLQHHHQQNHTDMKGWCSDTAVKKVQLIRATTLFSLIVGPFLLQRGDEKNHYYISLGFVHILS